MSNSDCASSLDTPSTAKLIGVVPPSVATELRRRRELLGWSQVEAARRSGVSRTVINEIEAGRRVPQTRTYEKLRDALGLAAPAAVALLRDRPTRSPRRSSRSSLPASSPAEVDPACPRRRDRGLDPRVREGVLAVDDGAAVRLSPLPWAEEAVSALATLEGQHALTDEAVQVLACVGVLGSPTRREVENLRGEDCESLMARLARQGFLVKTRDDSPVGDPNIYRLTALALGAMGHATIESFHAWCATAADGSTQVDELLKEPASRWS